MIHIRYSLSLEPTRVFLVIDEWISARGLSLGVRIWQPAKVLKRKR